MKGVQVVEEKCWMTHSIKYRAIIKDTETFEAIDSDSQEAIRRVLRLHSSYTNPDQQKPVTNITEANPVSALSRFAHNHKLKVEFTILEQDRVNGYIYKVTVDGLVFVSDRHSKKKDAKAQVAQVFFNLCRLL